MNEVVHTKVSAIDSLIAEGRAFAALGMATRDIFEIGESYQTLTALARIEYFLGFFQRSKRSWQRALQIKNEASGYAGLGSVLFRQGDKAEAIAAFLTGLKLEPDNVALLSSMAAAHLYLHDYISAQRYAARALRVDPDHADAMLCRARAESMLGNSRLAEMYIETLVRTGYKPYEVALLQIDLLTHKDEHETALVLAAELCEKHPNALESLARFRHAFRVFQNDPIRYSAFLAVLDIPWFPTKSLLSKSAPQDDQVRIDVIIPIHNALPQLEACLQSVHAHSGNRLGKLILVNDGSAPETVDALNGDLSAYAQTVLVHTPHRSCFTSAVMRGLAESDSSAFVVLNSKTLVSEGWLDRLYGGLRNTAKTAMVGPMSNNAMWQNYVSVFAEHDLPRATPIPNPRERQRMERIGRRFAGLVPLPILQGFCVMVDRSAYDAVGGFDLRAFPDGYGETQDLSMRLTRAGFDLFVVTDCLVYHAQGDNISDARHESLTQSARAALFEKHTALNYLCLEMACCTDPVLTEIRKAYDTGKTG